MLATTSYWTQNPSSDHFGELRRPTGYRSQSLNTGALENYYYYYSSQSSQSSSPLNNPNSPPPDINMPSKSSRRSSTSTVDADYEWDSPSPSHDPAKKSRSKIPVEEKLIVRLSYPSTTPPINNSHMYFHRNVATRIASHNALSDRGRKSTPKNWN